MNTLCHTALEHLASGTPLVLATMMDQQGSVPRMAGARMLVLPDGGISGTVGGGRYEAETIAVAKALHRQAGTHPQTSSLCPGAILEYCLRGATDMDMICGGDLALLLEYLPADIPGALSSGITDPARTDGAQKTERLSRESPVRTAFAAGRAAEESGDPFVFVTRIRREGAGTPIVPEESGRPVPSVPGVRYAALVERFFLLPRTNEVIPPPCPALPEEVLAAGAAAVNSGKTRRIVLADGEYLLEPFPRPFRIVLFGGGHVSLAVAKLAHTVGFHTRVVDDRPEFANSGRFPESRIEVTPSLNERDCAAVLARMNLSSSDGVVIVTRGHSHDRQALGATLGSEAGYVGMIGSRTKRSAVYAALREKGVREERLQTVRCPIGITIDADTPEEIAVSIVAELIQWRKNAQKAVPFSGVAA
jgi:xanthine dehydrogenase accessory factor